MNLSKKLLSILLACILLLAVFPAIAGATEPIDIANQLHELLPETEEAEQPQEDEDIEQPLPQEEQIAPLLPEADAASTQAEPAPSPTLPPNPDHIKSIAITHAPSVLEAGKSYLLQAKVENYRHEIVPKNVAWMSNNPNVLTVSPTSGIVRAKNAGTATIIARTKTQSGVMRSFAKIKVVTRGQVRAKIRAADNRVYTAYNWPDVRISPSGNTTQYARPNMDKLWADLRPMPYAPNIRLLHNGNAVEQAVTYTDKNGKYVASSAPGSLPSRVPNGDYLGRATFRDTQADGTVIRYFSFFKVRVRHPVPH